MRSGSWLVFTLILVCVTSLALGRQPGNSPRGPTAGGASASAPAARKPPTVSEDEEELRLVGLQVDGPSLVEFFRQRAAVPADPKGLQPWIRRLNDVDPEVRTRAAHRLLGRGTVALPLLRRVANDLGDPELADRAQHCIDLIERRSPTNVTPVAAVRLLLHRKPAGAVEALLAYLPTAESPALVEEVSRALTAMAYANEKPHAALLAALTDNMPLRRAVAASALAGKDHPEARPAVRKLLRDSKPLVRLRVALALASANDLDGVPVLIELLAEVVPPRDKPIEELLGRLAGDWAPTTPQGDDAVARRIRRAAWASWWRNSDSPALLAQMRRHTLSSSDQAKVLALIDKLGDDSFEVRQTASGALTEFGTLAIPLLRQATRSTDAERARRAETCLQDIADRGGKPLPEPVLRLLSLRQPAGAVEALLDYLPHAEIEHHRVEVRKALAALAVRAGRLEPALVRALADPLPGRRLAAAEAILAAGTLEQRAAVRKLLRDTDPSVRLRIAAALAGKREREAIPVLIELVAEESSDASGEAEEILYRLAGEGGPKVEPDRSTAGRRQRRDAWAAWWKQVAPSVNLGVLENHVPLLGYTLLVNNKQVLELDQDGKPRWIINNLPTPLDAHVLPGDRVLIAEFYSKRVTERDFQGAILWQKEGLEDHPVNVQRLANGNTFIATVNGLLEVDRAGKTVWSKPFPNLTAACKSRDGSITCLDGDGQCIRLSSVGKELKRFPSGGRPTYKSAIDVSADGRILIALHNQVSELDAEGKVLWQAPAPGITTATHLPNGHVLVAGGFRGVIMELDRSSKVVWESKPGQGGIRARRR